MLREGVLQTLSNTVPQSPPATIRVGAAAESLPGDVLNEAGLAQALLSLAEPLDKDRPPPAAMLPTSDQAARLAYRLRQPSLAPKPAPVAGAEAGPQRSYPEVPLSACGTKLCLAVMRGDMDTVGGFIHGVPFRLDEWGDDGRAALHVASCIGDKGMVVALLKGAGGVGADVNHCSSFGLNAAHFAAAKGHVRVLEYLIGAGADLAARTVFNATPLDLARCNGRGEAAALLLAQHAPAGGVWSASAEVQARVQSGLGHRSAGTCMMATLLGVPEPRLFALCSPSFGQRPSPARGAGPGNRR
jgi:hypothetical protein